MSATLGGKKSTVEIRWGGDPEGSEVPLVCASMIGYSPLNNALRGAAQRDEIAVLSDWLRSTRDGPYVALIDSDGTRRPLALIQADTSDSGAENYYEIHRPRPSRDLVWRDFYFRTVLTAVREADARWSPEEIEVTHPTGGAWSRDLLATTLDALGHLADSTVLRASTIRLGCIHGVDEADFQWAMSRFNQEQGSQNSTEFHDFEVEAVESGNSGAPDLAYVEVLGIEDL